MMTYLRDNLVWHTLFGPHAQYASGTDTDRRYAPGFPPIIGFSDIGNPDFNALIPFAEPGEHLYCDGWSGVAPGGWRIEFESAMRTMIWDGSMPAADGAPEAVLLGSQHASAVLELTDLIRPGPFGPRAIELGEYIGVFDGPRLVAMAGGRLCAGGFAEISSVCTHPDFRGMGLARRLVVNLVRRQTRRGETPFLRVLQDNAGAYRLYQRMGFRDIRESVARIVSWK